MSPAGSTVALVSRVVDDAVALRPLLTWVEGGWEVVSHEH